MIRLATRPRRLRLVTALAASVALLAAACDNPVDESENKLPYKSEADTGGGDGDAGTCDCLTVGDWYRFDKLAITSIDGEQHPAIGALNPLWSNDIAAHELSILLEVTALTDTEVTFRALDGARIDGTEDQICAITATAGTLTLPRSGCVLGDSTPLSFNVYSGAESFPKNCSTTLPVTHVIPVSKTILAGTVAPSCDAIDGTVPSGALGESALNQICTCILSADDKAEKCGDLDPSYNTGAVCAGCNSKYISLGGLLLNFGEVQWKCTDDEGGRAACIEATWHAARLDASPPECTHSPP